jgi:hypothetical protein
MRLATYTLWLSLAVSLPAYGQQATPEKVSVGTVIVERKPIEKSLVHSLVSLARIPCTSRFL